MTPEKWAEIVNWAMVELKIVLNTKGVTDGVSPDELDLLAKLKRLKKLHQQASKIENSDKDSQPPESLTPYRLTKVYHAGMAPDDQLQGSTNRYQALLDEYLAKTDKDRVCFDAVSYHGAYLLQEGILPPWDLRVFLADVLHGHKKPPRRSGRPRNVASRNRIIAAAVWDVASKFGLRPTRNEATTTAQSACDAIADAMRALNKSPRGHVAIKKIWMADQKAGA
jgi:hypothetical protein